MRTEAEVIASIKESIKTSDPSIDVEKGPVKDLLLDPVAPEIALQSSAAEHVAQLYSIQFVSASTQTEVDALANNFALAQGSGTTAKTTVFAMRFTRPQAGEIIKIEAGQLCGTRDATYLFKYTESAQMLGSNADVYYNASKSSYEIEIPVESIGVGEDYNLPAYRINTMVSSITGIDRIENRVEAKYGKSAETKDQEVTRIQNKFLGLDKGTPGGLESYVRNYSPEDILDVTLTSPKDRGLFYRVVFGPALDIFPFGIKTDTYTFSYKAIGGETELVLPKAPVLSISSVTINDTEISTYQFSQDTSLEYGGSTRASEKIVFDVPLLLDDNVVIIFVYDALVDEIQSNLFASETLFSTDVLVRRPLEIYAIIELQYKVLPSYAEEKVQADIEAKLYELIEPGIWISKLEPEVVRTTLEQQVSGISNIYIKKFKTKDSGSEIETISFKTNEKSILDSTSLKVGAVG